MTFVKNWLVLFWSLWSQLSIVDFWPFFEINHVCFEFLKVCKPIHYFKGYIINGLILLIVRYKIRIEVFHISLTKVFEKFTFDVLLQDLNITFMDHWIFDFVLFCVFKFIYVCCIELKACLVEFLFCYQISYVFEYFNLLLFNWFHQFYSTKKV